jgi:hypothetical protein
MVAAQSRGEEDDDLFWLQLIDWEGNRQMADSGFCAVNFQDLMVDSAGGCWVFWQENQNLRTLHLNNSGDLQRNTWTWGGEPVFSDPYHYLESTCYDRETDAVWVASRMQPQPVNTDAPEQIRLQLLGERWMDAPGVDHPIPTDFAIRSVRPNPFNSRTEVTFSLPQAMDAKLELLDLQGRRVQTLALGRLSRGEHQASLDGSNLAAGLYFVKLRGGGFERTVKIVLVK